MNPHNGIGLFVIYKVFFHVIKEISCNVGESKAPILKVETEREEEASSVLKKM